MSELSHFDETGASRMVDVSDKPITARFARAVGYVHMQPETLKRICDRSLAKGNVLEVARLAGLMAAKKTADLIPLCHPLPIDGSELNLQPVNATTLRIEALFPPRRAPAWKWKPSPPSPWRL